MGGTLWVATGACCAAQASHYAETLRTAMHEFEHGGAQQIRERLRSDQRAYRKYADASLGPERPDARGATGDAH